MSAEAERSLARLILACEYGASAPDRIHELLVAHLQSLAALLHPLGGREEEGEEGGAPPPPPPLAALLAALISPPSRSHQHGDNPTEDHNPTHGSSTSRTDNNDKVSMAEVLATLERGDVLPGIRTDIHDCPSSAANLVPLFPRGSTATHHPPPRRLTKPWELKEGDALPPPPFPPPFPPPP